VIHQSTKNFRVTNHLPICLVWEKINLRNNMPKLEIELENDILETGGIVTLSLI
jgi:hypothetical protein